MSLTSCYIQLKANQIEHIEQVIKSSMNEGHWILLQNCHLAPEMLATLEKEINSTTTDSIHVDFRLWLTTKPSSSFPVRIFIEFSYSIFENLNLFIRLVILYHLKT